MEALFDIEGTKSLDSNAVEFVKEGINFIGRTFEDNGIQGKICKREFDPNKPYTITATVIGNYKYVKYQKEEYYCSQNINKLTPKPIFTKWNDNIAYFLVSNIQKFVSQYDRQQGGYKLDDIKKHVISLPITNKGDINFDFIESFIKELETEQANKLKTYLHNTELDNYILNEDEQRALSIFQNIKFEAFNATDVFDIKNTHNILSSDIVKNSGNTPYLCASAENNAVDCYISYKTELLEPGNCIFIGGKTFVVSYQEKDFFSNDSHNLILSLKNDKWRNKLNYLYLVTCIRKSLAHKYSWGDSISNKKIQKDVIYLPTKNHKVDYDCMANLISAIQKLVIKDVVLYTRQKINAYNKIIETNTTEIGALVAEDKPDYIFNNDIKYRMGDELNEE